MRKLTPAQEEARSKREQRGANIAQGKSDGPSAGTPLAFHEAVAAGEPVIVNLLELEIAGFTLSNLPKAARLLLQCPEILVTHAVANKDAETFDTARTAGVINRGREQADLVTAEAVAQTLGSVGSRMTEEEAGAMLDLVHLAAQRRQREVTREGLDEVLDIPSFLLILRAVLRENPNLADPF